MTHPEPVSVPTATPPEGGGPGVAPPAAPRLAGAESYATGVGLDPALADLAEEITARLQAGEPFDPDDYEARHPQWAGQIRGMLPVLQEMAELARSVAGGLGVGRTRSLDGATDGERIVGDFRIVREVGRGGMGIVYEAEQRSLGRRVALKVLPLAAAMDRRALQRFQLEAQATAWLQHHQIVPVYAVGSLGEVPYYAMQYIEGASLAELIAELRRFEARAPQSAAAQRSSALTSLARGLLSGRFEPASQGAPATAREPAAADPPDDEPAPAVVRGREYARTVASLGVQAAEALDFAHGQGILHRDVKPANLLLDRRGVLWVTDFGLARLPGDGGVTMTGDVLGTLRYMSPEQALSRRALIDRRTDVYSLGATLYELLTLRPIVAGNDRQEILRTMMEQDPAPVRRLNPAVPMDLATIVAKAICRDPERRYASAQHFADDLKRFLEGRPIAARRTGRLRRAWGWCRRKPLPASLAAALALALASGFVGVTLSWREAVRKRDQLETANAQERAARALAQRQFELASEAVEKYYTGASEEVLLKRPEMSDLRKRLLGTALSFYQRLQATIEAGPRDPGRQAELAAIYRRVGQIAVEIGSRQDGLEALDRARAILEKLVAQGPAGAGPRRDLAWCIAFIGRLQVYTAGQEAEGLRALERALALYETLVAEHPDNADDLYALATTVGEIGYERARAGRAAEGLALLARERRLLQRLARDHSDRPVYRAQLALTYGEIGRIQANAGRIDEALASHGEATAHLEALAAQGPADGLTRRRLGQVVMDTGRVLADAGRPADALPHVRRALAILEPLAAEAPAVHSYQRAVAECYDVLGAAQARMGRAGDALQSLAKARATLEHLNAEHPDFVAYQADLAENHLWTGAVYQDQGRRDAALRELSRARAVLGHAPQGCEGLYALARTDALIAVLTGPAEHAAQGDRAMIALRRAVDQGYRAVDVLRTDPCLDALRGRADFRALLLDLQFPADPFRW